MSEKQTEQANEKPIEKPEKTIGKSIEETEKTEIETLNAICREAKTQGKLSGKNLTDLYELFGQRFTKSLEALRENRVKKYIFKPSGRIVWIVVGRERDYLLMPEAEFCTCDDFYYRVLDRKIHLCYHLIAQKIARNLGWYETIEETDDLHTSLMAEWKKATT
jgi:predicted nucleic acid-binding Zn finger protein